MANKKLIDELLERNRAMPLKKMYLAVGKEPLPACPNCGEILIIGEHDHFCRACGQRLDVENWAIS